MDGRSVTGPAELRVGRGPRCRRDSASGRLPPSWAFWALVPRCSVLELWGGGLGVAGEGSRSPG